ncbi:MAG TPA: NADH-quinone oxidoreductase subunit J [Aggregatilineaceae bacterium]|nr:NADH-quinone oxidoreductase subunit J [Aggregatilineaceae bacterium]
MLDALLIAGTVVCAIRAIRARHLLSAALWLAGVSALTALMLYKLGAEQVAVVELSVGAGLVTVLFVFAISIAGDDGLAEREFIPNWFTVGLVGLFLLILGIMLLPLDEMDGAGSKTAMAEMLWENRTLDVLLQTVLIFSGVLCLLGLLTDSHAPAKHNIPHEANELEIEPMDERPEEMMA